MPKNEEVLEQLQPIFRNVFDQNALTVRRETSAKDIPEWDSLAHINLVVAIEKKFRIKFALGELQSLRHVGDMVDLIVRKSEP